MTINNTGNQGNTRGGGQGGGNNNSSGNNNGGGGGNNPNQVIHGLPHGYTIQPGPKLRVRSLKAGQQVHCFHRYCQDPNGFFMVNCKSQGALHPAIGRTDGWTTAIVTQNWDSSGYHPHRKDTWPEIRWTHPLWFDRRGKMLDVEQENLATQRVPADQVRHPDQGEEAVDTPLLSVLAIRWGGAQRVDPVTEGVGGWGRIGSTCSDNYINALESHLYHSLGPKYEVMSCFVQNTSELQKLESPLIRNMLRGKNVAAFYYLWPIGFIDGHEYPGYVDRADLFKLMNANECHGIPTRFPHHSHMYKFLASKEWCATQCLRKDLRVPLSTRVPRALVSRDQNLAAKTALDSLQKLSQRREELYGRDYNPYLTAPPGTKMTRPKLIERGVCKLGWSWEALDVRKWTNPNQMARSLTELVEQPGSHMDYVFVQEWVDFDVEIRNYVVNPNLDDPESLKPRGTVFTQFQEETNNGGFTNFTRFGREQAVQTVFGNDEQCMQDIEAQIQELIRAWCFHIHAECSELPIFIRFDILAKKVGDGKASITTGELTELGGCFLGWNDGIRVVFQAIIDSCLERHYKKGGEASVRKSKSRGESNNMDYEMQGARTDL